MRGVEGAIFRGMSTYFSTDMTVVKILHIGGEQNWTKYMGVELKCILLGSLQVSHSIFGTS